DLAEPCRARLPAAAGGRPRRAAPPGRRRGGRARPLGVGGPRPGARPRRPGRGADHRPRAAGEGGGGAPGRGGRHDGRGRRGGRRGRRRPVHRGRRRGPRAALVRHAGDPRPPGRAGLTPAPSGLVPAPPRPRHGAARRPAPCRLSVAAGTFSGMGTHRDAHIAWDRTGTLFHDVDAVIGATNAAFAELGLEPLTLERYRELYCVPVPKFYERLLGRLPSEAEWELMDATFHRYYTEHRVRCGLAEGVAELL